MQVRTSKDPPIRWLNQNNKAGPVVQALRQKRGQIFALGLLSIAIYLLYKILWYLLRGVKQAREPHYLSPWLRLWTISGKARFFREMLERAGAAVLVPDLAQGDFEHLTITGQLGVINQTVGRQPAALVGSSMGGYLSALFAGGHSEITRLVLLAPAFEFARRWPAWLGGEAVEAWRRSGWMEVFHYGENRPCRLSYALLEDGMRYEDYPAFAQPALIFHGLHDDVVPVEYSRQFVANHSNARLEIVDSGHELLDVLDDIGRKVSRFLLDSANPQSRPGKQ